jgi:acetolactate synthase-1/2/3 large subunit
MQACRKDTCIGLFGRFDRIANAIIKEADLVIAVGFKFGEIATARYSLMPKDIRVVHIDISPEEIGRHQRVSVALWADAKAALADLLEEMEDGSDSQRKGRQGYVAEILARKQEWVAKNRDRLRSDEKPIHMARLCHELTRAMPENGILVADGGFAAHWTGLFYDTPCAGRTFVANRGNASIGYGLPGYSGARP